jgi:hypothetical protein
MFNVRRIIKLIPIFWGFFIFNGYGQKLFTTTVLVNKVVMIEIKLRMSDVLEKIVVNDLNDKKKYDILCNENDYYIGKDTSKIMFEKKLIELKKLKKKGGKLKFNVIVYSKSGRPLYTTKIFNPSSERIKKVIKIEFI